MKSKTVELLARSIIRYMNGEEYEHLVYEAQELEDEGLYVTIEEILRYKGMAI